MERISILGCGWLGLPLARVLIARGHQVKGSTTSAHKLKELEALDVEPYLLQLSESEIRGPIQDFLQSDLLVINIPPKRSSEIIKIYSNQFLRLLDELQTSAIKKVLFVSTTSVYQNTNGRIDENTSPLPEKPSGIATLKVEKMLMNSEAFKTSIIRFAGLIGPNRYPGRFLAGKNDVSGADSPVNLIHLDDCIGIIQALIEKNLWGEIFNGCSPDHPTKKDFYTTAAEKINLPPPAFSRNNGDLFKIVDGSKVERMLSYQYQHIDLIKTLDVIR